MSRAGNTPAARLICDETTAKRLADQLSGHFELSESAVAAFAGVDGRWHVEIHFPAPPDEAAVRQLVAAAGGRSEELTFEEIAAKDWVAASLAELKPVTAGRFTVHGAHDRAAVAPNRRGIQSDLPRTQFFQHHPGQLDFLHHPVAFLPAMWIILGVSCSFALIQNLKNFRGTAWLR